MLQGAHTGGGCVTDGVTGQQSSYHVLNMMEYVTGCTYRSGCVTDGVTGQHLSYHTCGHGDGVCP